MYTCKLKRYTLKRGKGLYQLLSLTDAKLDAVELLLHSFSSAATYLNPQATRCACLYSLDFDPSGSVVGALVRVGCGWGGRECEEDRSKRE